MGNRGAKGSVFERQFCKELSLWWTEGLRDDVFWRTAGSGSRATNRGRKGKVTAGSYGDIAATDSCGEPLLKLLTFELKRGYNRETIQDVLDRPDHASLQTYEQWILQAEDSAKLAGSVGWAIVFRRDRRTPMIMISERVWKLVLRDPLKGHFCPCARLELFVGGWFFLLFAITLNQFLQIVAPEHIHKGLKEHGKETKQPRRRAFDPDP